MNEPSSTQTSNDHPIIDQCANTAKQVSNRTQGWGGPAISLVSYGLIIGFALSGIAIMGLSSLVWLVFNTSLFSGFGLLTGGILLSAATALFLGKLTKAGDALYRKRQTS